MRKIQLKRGLKVNMPTLSQAELGFTTDEETLYIGTGSKNIPLAPKFHTHTASDLSAHKATHLPGGSDPLTVGDLGGYTKDETLKTATKTLLGLAGTAVPDDALKSLASGSYDIVSGVYTGDDSLNRFIDVGRTCSIVFSMAQLPSMNDNLVHIGIRTSSFSTGLYTNAYGSGFYANEGLVSSTGFYTSYEGSGGVSVTNNKSGVTYYYYAFCKKG